mgnify:CR=1 FL=1
MADFAKIFQERQRRENLPDLFVVECGMFDRLNYIWEIDSIWSTLSSAAEHMNIQKKTIFGKSMKWRIQKSKLKGSPLIYLSATEQASESST